MTALRAVIAVLALAALVASALIPAPGSFAISGPAAILILLLGFGSIAADALPLRAVPLACSVLTVPLAVLLMVQPVPGVVLAVGILALQAVAWWAARRADAGAAAMA
ncbi:MAG: hypothetical protein ACKO2Y_07925 [Actinomycetota bacterium]